MKPVLFHRSAEEEVDEAVAFYESRRSDLGRIFPDEVNHAVNLIQRFPAVGSLQEWTSFRYLTLQRFPYLIFYLELSDAVWIAAVAHGKRQPGY